MLDTSQTAIILIGFQNDYFQVDGVLAAALEPKETPRTVLRNTLDLINRCQFTTITMVSVPLTFTPTYGELIEPIGILKAIKEAEAFKLGTKGSETVPEIKEFGNRILEVHGKHGLNAFSNTSLHALLSQKGCSTVVLAGVITSLCIDSTCRAASEHGYRTILLSDCTGGRSAFEQKFYCEEIFPLYTRVTTHNEFLESIGAA